MKKVVASLVIILLLSSSSYALWPFNGKSETTDETLGREQSEFLLLVDSFSKDTDKLQTEVKEGKDVLISFQAAVKVAANRNVEFRKVYDKWNSVNEKNKEVVSKFKNLIIGAEEFYKSAENHANSINDSSLKKEALVKIKNSKDKYLVRLSSVKVKLDELSKMKVKVDDTMKFIEVVQAMEVIEERIKIAFDEIEVLIPSLMNELKQLDVDSRKLLNSISVETIK